MESQNHETARRYTICEYKYPDTSNPKRTTKSRSFHWNLSTPKVLRLNPAGLKPSNRGFKSFNLELFKVEEDVIFFYLSKASYTKSFWVHSEKEPPSSICT